MANYDLLPLGNNPKKKKTLNYDEALNLLGGAKPPESSLLSHVGDAGLDLAKGVVGAGEAAIGIGDIATGGTVGKLLQDYAGYDPKRTKAIMSDNYSVARQQANQDVEDASGFIGTTAAMLKNPSTIAGTVLESAPSMIGGGGSAQLLGKGGILLNNPVARGAIGEGLVGAGQTAEQIRQENPDGLLTPKQSLASTASGITTGLIGFGGGKLAQKMGVLDPQTVLAGGYPLPNGLSSRQTLGNVAKGFVSEGALQELPQSATEQMWQNYAQDNPLMEGVPEASAAGLLASGVMGGGTNLMHARHAKSNESDSSQQAPYTEPPTDQLLLGNDNPNNPNSPKFNPNLDTNYNPVIEDLKNRADNYGLPNINPVSETLNRGVSDSFPISAKPTGAISKALQAGDIKPLARVLEGELVDNIPATLEQRDGIDSWIDGDYQVIEPSLLEQQRRLTFNQENSDTPDIPRLYAPNSQAKTVNPQVLRDIVRSTGTITPQQLMAYTGSNRIQAAQAIQAIKQEQQALTTDFNTVAQAKKVLNKLADHTSFEVGRLANSNQWAIVPKQQLRIKQKLPYNQQLTEPNQQIKQAPYDKKQPALNRKSINSDKDSLVDAVIKLGGISPDYRLDTTGDTQGNKSIVGVGYLWSHKNGTSIDDVARRLADEGYIPPQEANNYDGVRWLQEAIADELAGRKKHYSLNSEMHHLQQYEVYLQDKLEQERAIQEQEYASIRQQQGFEAEQQARFYDEQASHYFKQLEEQQHELERQTSLIDGEHLTETDASRVNDQLRQYDERIDQAQRTADQKATATDRQQQKITPVEQNTAQSSQSKKSLAEPNNVLNIV